jgi:hypothetical protein
VPACLPTPDASAAPCREVTEGLSPHCPLVFDPVLNATREEDGCAPRVGLVEGTQCDAKNQVGCQLGGAEVAGRMCCHARSVTGGFMRRLHARATEAETLPPTRLLT